MGEKKLYPPKEIEPYETVTLTADDGEMTFIGINDNRVVAFVAAYAELRHLTGLGGMVNESMRAEAARKVEAAFKALPGRLLTDAIATTQGRIIL